MRSRRTGIVRVAKAVAVSVVVCCIAAELVLRALPVQTGVRALPVDEQHPVARFTPNRTFVYSRGWSLSQVNRGRVNNVGFVNRQDYDSTLATPLVAVIGDEFVQALTVPYDSTLQGRLAKALAGRARVYSFAGSGAALAQYLAWADYVRTTFRPARLIVVVSAHDADQSLLKYWRDEGYYHFRETSTETLALERVDYMPSSLRQMLRSSALARYLLMNGPSLFSQHVGAVSGNSPTNPTSAREHDSERSADTFLAQLSGRAGLSHDQIAIIANATETPARYSSRMRDSTQSTYEGRLRRYLVQGARQAGYEVLDMTQIFAAQFARDSTPPDHSTEMQWSEAQHRTAAEALLESPVLRELSPSGVTDSATVGRVTQQHCVAANCAGTHPAVSR